jgi:hypothetical protein
VQLLERESDLVHVTPSPVLTGLERADDRVAAAMEVLRSVLVLRLIAAADVPADHAEPQVHPTVASLKALFASVSIRLNVLDQIEM